MSVCVHQGLAPGVFLVFFYIFLSQPPLSLDSAMLAGQKALHYHIQLLHGCLISDLKSSGFCSRTLLAKPPLLPLVGCFSSFVLEPSIYQSSILIHTYIFVYINQNYNFLDNFIEEQYRSSASLVNLCF